MLLKTKLPLLLLYRIAVFQETPGPFKADRKVRYPCFESALEEKSTIRGAAMECKTQGVTREEH